MKNLIFSTIFLFCSSVFGKAEPRPHSTSDLIFRIIIPGILFVLVIVAEIWASNKREKKTNELKAKEEPLKIFEYFRIAFGYNDEHSVRSAAISGWAVWCSLLLFQNRMVIVAETTLEIEIKNINFVKMRKVMLEEFLQVCYNEISESGTTREKAVFLQGIDKDMLYIKNFIEERMNRPKIIDLT